MKEYAPEHIRTVAVVGHGGCGKTTLVEAMAYLTGTIKRMGTIADKTTLSDFEQEELARKASLRLSVVPVLYHGCKINLIDAPGLFDFEAEQQQAIWASDSVLVVISGKSGLTVGAKKALQAAKRLQKPCMIFISKLDRESGDFYKVFEQLKTAFGPHICPVVVPHYEAEKDPASPVDCYLDLLDQQAYRYHDGTRTVDPAVPAGEHRLEGLMNAISEAVAETDEALFDKYFSGETFTEQELIAGVHTGVKAGDLIPVLCGSAIALEGVDLLLEGLEKLMPSAAEALAEFPNQGTVAAVFKTVSDPFVSKLSYVKVLSGTLSSEELVLVGDQEKSEKIGKLVSICGKQQKEITRLSTGDIGAVLKCSSRVATGAILHAADAPLPTLSPLTFPAPCYTLAIEPLAQGDESKIAAGIQRLLEEDQTLAFVRNNETHQSLLSGLGEQHLDVTLAMLKQKFGIAVAVSTPIIAYRETIQTKVQVQGRHKKQSGGHGQFGDVVLIFEPYDGEDLLFEEKVVGGAVPKSYFPAVEKGLRESMQKGILAGYPMVGVKATLIDGSYHPVDSSEMSFKMAAAVAYKTGIPQAKPHLLEPIGILKVQLEDAYTGDMMGEINKRRGRVLGMTALAGDRAGETEIEAEVPMSEMLDFSILVRQMTHGSGSFVLAFSSYQPLPLPLQERVIAARSSG